MVAGASVCIPGPPTLSQSRSGRQSSRLVNGPFMALAFVAAMVSSASATADDGSVTHAMTFRFGRFADAPDCGLPCSQFVVAEGMITPASWLRLGAMMTKMEGRRLPVLLNSPGGNILGAANLGRVFKMNAMPAVAAIAHAAPCDGAACAGEGAFDVQSYSFVAGDGALCASACPYAFAGSPHRFADLGSRFGVHAARLPEPIAQNLSPEKRERLLSAGVDHDLAAVRALLEEQGVSRDLTDLAQSVPSASMTWLRADQMARFGLLAETDAAPFLPAAIRDQLTLIDPNRLRP